MQVGSKYQRSRDLKDVAKDVRKDLRKTFGPSWKFSVRLSRYSMGQSLLVEIKEAPVCLFRRAEREHCVQYTKALELALETVQGILDSYNRQDIDLQTDYFNVDFYGHVQVHHKLRQRQMGALERTEEAA